MPSFERLPETRYQTHLRVRISDINYGGHLANDAVLRLVHEARLRWLGQMGFSEMNAGGPGLIMADCAIQFKRQAYYGDRLTLELEIEHWRRAGFGLVCTIARQEDLIAQVHTGMVFFDYGAQKICRTPEGFMAAVNALSGSLNDGVAASAESAVKSGPLLNHDGN